MRLYVYGYSGIRATPGGIISLISFYIVIAIDNTLFMKLWIYISIFYCQLFNVGV